MEISNDLREAYKGYYEDSHNNPPSDRWVEETIATHTPKERLDVYLTWNGIIGWTSRIFEIATGEL